MSKSLALCKTWRALQWIHSAEKDNMDMELPRLVLSDADKLHMLYLEDGQRHAIDPSLIANERTFRECFKAYLYAREHAKSMYLRNLLAHGGRLVKEYSKKYSETVEEIKKKTPVPLPANKTAEDIGKAYSECVSTLIKAAQMAMEMELSELEQHQTVTEKDKDQARIILKVAAASASLSI